MDEWASIEYMGVPIRVIPYDTAESGSIYVVSAAYDDDGRLVMSAAKLYELAEANDEWRRDR